MIRVKSDRLVKKMDIKAIAPVDDVINLIFKYSINAGIKVDVQKGTARVDNGSEEECIVIKNGEFKDNYYAYVVVQRQYGILSYANVYETGESLNAKKMAKNAQHNRKMDGVLDDLARGGGASGGGFKLMNIAYNKAVASANKTNEREVEAEKMYYDLVAQVVMLSLEEAGKNAQYNKNVNHVTTDSNVQSSTNTTYTETSNTATQRNDSSNTQNSKAKDFEKDYADFVNNFNSNSSSGPRHIDPNGSKNKQANSNRKSSNTNTNTDAKANTQNTENTDTATNSDAFAGFEDSKEDIIDKANEMFGVNDTKSSDNTTTNTNSGNASKDKPVPTDKKDDKKITFGDFVVWMLMAAVIALIFPAFGIYILGGAIILFIIAWFSD